MAPKSAGKELIRDKKHRIQHTKSQMGVEHDSNFVFQCFRRVFRCFENQKFE